MKALLGISNRHVHLCAEDYELLFHDIIMKKEKDLVQKGEFASNLFVDIQTEKNTIKKVRVLGPVRSYTQVELSKTECYTLGIDPPVKMSGDLIGAAEVTIIGPTGFVKKACAIIATRHVHLNHDDRMQLGLNGINKIKIKVGSEKSAVLDDVYVKETPLGVLEVHLDTDDGNANLLKTGDMVELIF